MTSKPVVSVIIPTYNWSSVLRYAIQSVLWQTFQDWELWVIGDGCTDDSEAVTLSFGDPRIHWHNLPENTGSQAAPNNKGIELAQGEFIAYLGHDDLWHPSHLQVLLHALQSNDGDLGYTITKLIQPLAELKVALCGLSISGQYEPVMTIPPSSVMHRRDVIRELGPWRTYDTSRVPIDLEIVLRMFAHQKRIIPVNELTVFKFPTTAHPNAYREKKSDEQREYAQRMEVEAEFRYRELLSVVTDSTHVARTFTLPRNVEFNEDYVETLNQSRLARGLETLAIGSKQIPVHEDLSSLVATNLMDDIAPLHDRQYLHEHGQLPENGLLLGANWYAREHDEWGRAFRWVNTDAEVLVTRPTREDHHLVLRVRAGPGNSYQPLNLQILDENNVIIGEKRVAEETQLEFEIHVAQGNVAVLRLRSDAAGKRIEDSARIMNFAVYGFWWKNREPDALRVETAWLRERLATAEQQVVILQADAQAERAWLLQSKQEVEGLETALREENEWLRSVKREHEATIERLLNNDGNEKPAD